MKRYKTYGAFLKSLPDHAGPLPASSITSAVCDEELPQACTITQAELEHALEENCYKLVDEEGGVRVIPTRPLPKTIKPAAVEPALQQAYFHGGGPGLTLEQREGQIVAVLD